MPPEVAPAIHFREQIGDLDPWHKPIGLTGQQLRFIRLLIVERRDLQHAVRNGGVRQLLGLGEPVYALEFSMQKLTALREVFFGIEFDRERQACRSHGDVCLRRQQVIIEVPISAAAGNR